MKGESPHLGLKFPDFEVCGSFSGDVHQQEVLLVQEALFLMMGPRLSFAVTH